VKGGQGSLKGVQVGGGAVMKKQSRAGLAYVCICVCACVRACVYGCCSGHCQMLRVPNGVACDLLALFLNTCAEVCAVVHGTEHLA